MTWKVRFAIADVLIKLLRRVAPEHAAKWDEQDQAVVDLGDFAYGIGQAWTSSRTMMNEALRRAFEMGRRREAMEHRPEGGPSVDVGPPTLGRRIGW